MLTIAECPRCGARRYSWEEEDAIAKLSTHTCAGLLPFWELDMILDEILQTNILVKGGGRCQL